MAVPKLPPPNTTTFSAASMGLMAFVCFCLKALLHRIRDSQLSWIWLRSEGGYKALPLLLAAAAAAAAAAAVDGVAGVAVPEEAAAAAAV
jgi:hypothetical protein